MPRRARLNLPGIAWHIIQRGNNRAVCFYAEDDYLFYLPIFIISNNMPRASAAPSTPMSS